MSKKKRKRDNRSSYEFSRSKRLDLQKSQSLVMAAQRAWKQAKYERAVDLYKRALQRDPGNAELMVDIARAYGLRQDFDRAQDYIERALKSDPQQARIQYMAGETFWMINRQDEAAVCFRQVLELDPNARDAPAALVTLARYHERHHRLDDAREALDRALAMQPDHEDGRLQCAILARRDGQRSEAISQLRSLLDRKLHSFQIESDAWYELGQLLDTEQDYDGAIDAAQRAKKLLRPHAGEALRQWKGVRGRVDRMLEDITKEDFQRWDQQGPAGDAMRLALLTGHPRSGTTLIEQVLDSHSDLISADEFATFSDWVFVALGMHHPAATTTILTMLSRTPKRRFAKARQDYWSRTEAMLDEPIGDRLLMDKNPELTYLVPMVNCVFPEMKVLFALRDPRDVVLSCFMQKLPLNSISVNYLSLEETARKYAHVMRHWLVTREHTKADWMELRYEDTVENLEAQARRLLSFLGLPWEEGVLQFHRHARKKLVRSPTYEAVTEPVHNRAIGRWKNYERHLAPHLEILEAQLDEFGYR